MIYKELKTYFENTDLPLTLNGDHKVYLNVPNTAKIYINCIQRQIEIHGRDIKSSQIAKTYKHNLQELYNDLQDRSKWNLGLYKLDDKKTL